MRVRENIVRRHDDKEKKPSGNRNKELQLLFAITTQLTSNVTCMVRYNHSKRYMREGEYL